MKLLFLSLFVLFCISQNTYLLVFSPKTPAKLREFFKDFPSVMLESFQESSIVPSLESPSLILDASLDPSLLTVIDSLAGRFNSPYLTISKPFITEKSFYRFYAFPSIHSEAESLIKLLKYLNWNSFFVFLSNSMENLLTLDLIRETFDKFQVKSCVYDSETTEDQLDALVKRFVKVNDDHNLLVLDQGSSLELMVKILEKRKVGKVGKYFVFGASTVIPASVEGSLSLVYAEGLNATNLENFYIQILSNLIERFKYYNKAAFDQRCPEQVCLSEQLIVNYRYGEKDIVGKVGDSVSVNKQIIFPGNNTENNSDFKKTILPIMIANGTREPNDLGNSEVTSRFYYGALLAVEQTNSQLKNFEYKLIPTDCGNTKVNITWSVECLSQFARTNSLAYITGYWAHLTLGNLIAFQTFHRFLPQISPSGFSDILNNKTIYPEFIKLTGRLSDFTENTIFLYRFYNWKKTICIVAEDKFWKNYFDYITIVMKQMGISCVNPEGYRNLPNNYTRDDFENYKHIFEYAKNSRCRNILIIAFNTGVIYEGFYDIGLRKGDIIIVGYMENYYTLLENIEEKYLLKRKEVMSGGLIINQIHYRGELGKKIENQLKKKHGTVVNMGLTYDAFKTINNSIFYIASKGEDYEDPKLLMKVMRNQRFVGCSGEVYFIPGENSRDSSWLEVSQIKINPKTNQVDLFKISEFNKFSMIVAREINEPEWPTGEKSVPSNFRPLQICVYEKTPEISKYGKLSLHIVSLIYLILVIVCAVFSYRRFNYSVTRFTENVHLTYNDIIHQFFMVCELLQILSLEPQDGILSKSTNNLNRILNTDLITSLDLKFDDFWNFYTLLLVLCGVWSVLASLSFLIKREVLNSNQYLFILKFLSNSLIPIIGHICFLPLSLMLLSIYKCEEGISDDLFESFLYRDCTEFCYKGKHKQVVIISIFTIAIFLSVSIFLRPTWEIGQDDQHIRTKVSYFSVLSVFQFVLVLIHVNFEKIGKISEGFLMFGVLICMVLITARMNPYNYEKSNIFQLVILSVCSWNMIVTRIYFILPYESHLKVILFSGIGLIFAFGFKIASRYPTRFISDYFYAIPILIKFQFSKDVGKTIKMNTFYKNIEEKIHLNDKNRVIRLN